ncbi:MAG: antibiotic biosynthesis monooxygenase [Galbitalea sp.]
MIIEHAVLPITPGREAEFEAAFAEAKRIIAVSPGFRDLSLCRCVERPSAYLLLVHWDFDRRSRGRLPGIRGVRRMGCAAAPLLFGVDHRRTLRAGRDRVASALPHGAISGSLTSRWP